jgi:MOSC domain-containing protein YiiM
MPLRGQPALEGNEALARDVEVFRTMRDIHDNHLGVYANVVEPGVVSVGDAVTVE